MLAKFLTNYIKLWTNYGKLHQVFCQRQFFFFLTSYGKLYQVLIILSFIKFWTNYIKLYQVFCQIILMLAKFFNKLWKTLSNYIKLYQVFNKLYQVFLPNYINAT